MKYFYDTETEGLSCFRQIVPINDFVSPRKQIFNPLSLWLFRKPVYHSPVLSMA